MNTEADSAIQAAGPLELDPFSFHGDRRSRIVGLGGAGSPPSDHYAFHTPYVATATGHVHFVLQFTNLQAKKGTLQLLVNMLPDEAGAPAVVANSYRIALNRLVQQGGQFPIRFEGFRNVRFALHGIITDETDAAATALTILLDRPATADGHGEPVTARSTSYGRDSSAPTSELHAVRTPVLQVPLSQAYTASQLQEPFAEETSRRLGISRVDPVARWSTLYGLRAIQTYGLAERGARGLCLGLCPPVLVEELERLGCEMTTLPAWEDRGFDSFGDTDAAPNAAAALFNFDFFCLMGATDRVGPTRDYLQVLEGLIQRLRPGGLAIYVLPFMPRQMQNQNRLSYLDRENIERLALNLISRKNEVAQLLLEGTGMLTERAVHREPSAYGLIARRAPSVL